MQFALLVPLLHASEHTVIIAVTVVIRARETALLNRARDSHTDGKHVGERADDEDGEADRIKHLGDRLDGRRKLDARVCRGYAGEDAMSGKFSRARAAASRSAGSDRFRKATH